jgi:phasin family protein
MITPEQFQHYGKEQFESAVESAGTLQRGCQAIATTVGDYAKKSFGEGSAFVEKLAGTRSLDKAMEAHAEYAKSAQETFVAESQKIAEMYTDLAKQAFKPFEGLFAGLKPSR